MLASFSIVPIGGSAQLRNYVAQVIDIVERSGLNYRLGAMHTTVEGERRAVMALIMKCHSHIAKKVPRVLTTIQIDDRRGTKGRLTGKVTDVEKVLGRKVRHE